jgi:hypothetical protein
VSKGRERERRAARWIVQSRNSVRQAKTFIGSSSGQAPERRTRPRPWIEHGDGPRSASKDRSFSPRILSNSILDPRGPSTPSADHLRARSTPEAALVAQDERWRERGEEIDAHGDLGHPENPRGSQRLSSLVVQRGAPLATQLQQRQWCCDGSQPTSSTLIRPGGSTSLLVLAPWAARPPSPRGGRRDEC